MRSSVTGVFLRGAGGLGVGGGAVAVTASQRESRPAVGTRQRDSAATSPLQVTHFDTKTVENPFPLIVLPLVAKAAPGVTGALGYRDRS